MSAEWSLTWVDQNDVRRLPTPVTDSWERIAERERAAGIYGPFPIMVDPELRVDFRLSEFFRRSRFAALARGTQETYAIDYRLFFAFLWSRGLRWDQAREDDVRDWHAWRRLDPTNPRRIGGAKWNRELVAFRLLYDWAARKRYVAESPVVLQDLRARDARSSNVKWLTRRAFNQWRNVGLRGYTLEGLPDRTFRGRQSDRNVAFAGLLFSTGARLREGGALLADELPSATIVGQRYYAVRIADATAKRGGRIAYISAHALSEVIAYRETTRSQSVYSARRRGYYDRLPNKLIVDEISASGEVRWHDHESGEAGRLAVNNIDASTRRRLFWSTDDGLEPLALWLDESGKPMDFESWKKIFREASRRCEAFGSPLRCTPHMLRHSFALHMLVSLQYAFDRRLGLTPQERRYYQEIYGNVWVLVRDLLGHASEETTRNIYLEPVRGLQLESILNEASAEQVDELMSRLSKETGLILDDL